MNKISNIHIDLKKTLITIKIKSQNFKINYCKQYKQKYSVKMSHKILTQQDQPSIISLQNKVEYHIPVEQSVFEIKIHKTDNLIGLVTHQIENEIQKSQIIISEQTKPFELDERNNYCMKNESKIDEKKIAEFVKKRKSLEQQILRLKLEQQEQKKKNRSKGPNETQYHKTSRSKFTTQQKLEVSHIMKKAKQFQQHIMSKQKQSMQKIEEQRMKLNEQREQYLQKLKQKNKQESVRKINRIKEEQQLRLQKLKLQNKRLQQIKKASPLHQKIEEHQKALQQLKRQKQTQILKQKRRSMTVDLQQIKAHEKRYYETARISKEMISNQFMERVQKMKQNQVRLAETFRPSKFLVTLFNEEKNKQIQQRQRIQKMKILFSKKNSFQQKLRQVHKQHIKTKPKDQMQRSIVQLKVQDHRLKAKSMSAADIYKQGQQYMKSAHSSINPVFVEQSKVQLQNNYKSIIQGSKTQYRNYLQESRLKKEEQYKSMGKLRTKEINPEMYQLESIITSKKQTDNDKLYQAKLIAQKLDHKARNSSTFALMDSIAAKLKIIEEFS